MNALSRPVPLSVAIITLNEADQIHDCIAGVRFADEIIVVDSGSTDGTPDIVRAAGGRVFRQDFLGFGAQKQFAVERCRHDWVLLIDADERIPPATALAVQAAVHTNRDGDPAAFALQRKNHLHGRWIRHCGWWPDPLVRLVNRHRGRFSSDPVHERWLTDGPIVALPEVIEHYSFRDYAEMIEKLQHYSTLGAPKAAAGKVRPWSPLSHGLWTFLQTYIIRLGFLDGFDGFMIALLNGGGSLMKYAKAWELRRFNNYSKPLDDVGNKKSSAP